jgi:nondiscriminating glutamyl-tRNA synthetase
MSSFFFTPGSDRLTVESARRALFLWLDARRQRQPFTVAGPPGAWREELRWLGLEWQAEEEQGDVPDWLRRLAPIEDSEPSPWGQWGGRTAVSELRELGVLPEALVNFLVLLGWELPAPPEGEEHQEVFSLDDLLAQWSPEKLALAPARFDFELLRRLNRAWLQRADLDRLVALAVPYYQRVGWLPPEVSPLLRLWLRDLIAAVLPGLDFLSLLPPRTRLVFDYHPEGYLRVPESRQAMEREGAREVLRLFSQKALEESWLTVERYHQILDELKRETHWRGRNLIQPIRVLLTGLPFGPGLEELLPVIERGAELDLPVRVKSCRERVLEFCSVFV